MSEFNITDPADEPSLDYSSEDLDFIESQQRRSSDGLKENLTRLQGLGSEIQDTRVKLAASRGNDEPRYEALAKQYERVLRERDSLCVRLSEVERLYNSQADMWEQVNSQTSIEIEMMMQRNRELKDLLASRDNEIKRLREDLSDLRKDLHDQRQHELTYQQAITRLEQYTVVRELASYHNRSTGSLSSPQRSHMKSRSPVRSSPRQSVKTGKFNGVFLLQENVSSTQHRDSDIGRQELRMPFLSKAGDEWIASLRSPSPPMKKEQKSADLEDLLLRDS